jgi:hypothetical protein
MRSEWRRDCIFGDEKLKLRAIASAPVLGALLLALTVSILLAASTPINDPYSTLNTQWNGTSALAEKGFLAVNADLNKTLSSTNGAAFLLLIGPTRQFTKIEAAFLEGFIRRGGLLLVADNFGSSNSLLDLLGFPVRFDGKLLIDPLFYRRQPIFPAISDFSASEFSTGLTGLVMDYGTVLDIKDQSNVKVLARSSPFSFLDLNQDGKKGPGEPSGPFPVLAELELGRGAVILFTSPASFANGLIHESNNVRLIENIMNGAIVRQGPESEGRAVFLLDETHLEKSARTSAKLIAQRLVISVLEGGMQLPEKLGLTSLAMIIVAGRYIYRKPSKVTQRTEPSQTIAPFDVESALRLHPTWNREKLEYVARELEASMRWRSSREEQ